MRRNALPWAAGRLQPPEGFMPCPAAAMSDAWPPMGLFFIWQEFAQGIRASPEGMLNLLIEKPF